MIREVREASRMREVLPRLQMASSGLHDFNDLRNYLDNQVSQIFMGGAVLFFIWYSSITVSTRAIRPASSNYFKLLHSLLYFCLKKI